MVINYAQGNETVWDMDVNAVMNAVLPAAIDNGCSVSKGSGDFDSDVTAGDVIINGVDIAVTAATVTHSDTSAMSAGESRIDLVTVDATDTVSITEGTAASNPDSPDIPADEVLLGFWHIAESDSTLADSDVFDIPALYDLSEQRGLMSVWSEGLAPGLGG